MSREIKFGVFLGGATYINVIPEVVLATEMFGYDSFWVSDHLFLPPHFYEAVGMSPEKGECPMLEAWTTMAAAAAITKKIRLGVGVTPIPLRHPGILAKQVATVDYISNGRVIFGVGAGWHRKEFEAYGISWDNHKVRIAKMLEGLEVIKRLWTQPFASFEGRYYRLTEAPLWPKPAQKPHPPVWFGGVSPSIMKAVAMCGDGWVPYCYSPDELRELFAKLRKVLEESNRKIDEITHACVTLGYVGSSYDMARRVAEPVLRHRGSSTLKPEEWEEAKERGTYGSPEDCISKIEEYIKAGVEHLLIEFISPKVYLDCIKLFGERVLPAFK